MDFGFSDEQDLLRAEVRKFLDASCPLEEVRRIGEAGEGLPPSLWKEVASLGWTGLTVPEAFGGAGLTFVDWVVLLEETGRSLFPGPLISSGLTAALIDDGGSDAQRQRWLPRIADGSAPGTLAVLESSDHLAPEGIALTARSEGDGIVLDGEKRFVHDAPDARLFVIAFRHAAGGVGLAVVEHDAAGLQVETEPGMDLTRRGGRLRCTDLHVAADDILAPGEDAWPILARALDIGACAVAAETAGAADAALAMTVRYAKERTQFGSPIGRFQSVKHPLAEIFVEVESLKSLVCYAAWALDERRPDAAMAVARAKAHASEIFPRIGIDTVQLHGGIGYTWEYDAQLYLKRSKWARPAYGDADHHYARIASWSGE